MILTKHEAAEMAFRPITYMGERIVNRCISKFESQSDIAFVKEFRKSTGLKCRLFAPGVVEVVVEK